MPVIVVIDDEYLQCEILKTILEDNGYEVYTATSAEDGLELIKRFNPQAVITDLKMKGMSGLELLGSISKEQIRTSVIIMTAFGTIPSAVEAIKKGAVDYLTKPLDKNLLLITVKNAIERWNLINENDRLKKELFERFKIDGIIGESKAMRDIMEIVKKVTPTQVTILIMGESGTGKELIARAIHYNSPRKTYPFIAINCAAIPENLIESELFGYEAGAFTGALQRKIGLFELANKGTLFLDEIGDLSLFTQTKLLRALQDREIRRIGGKDSIKIDVRIVAATNKDLEKEVEKGRFREDLYYRLKVVTVEIPPLRSRKEDIPSLVQYFIGRYNKEFGKMIKGVTDSVMHAFMKYHWPGNIRQLESVIERAVLMCDRDTISINDIKGELRQGGRGIMDIEIPDSGINFEELEKELIKKALIKSNNVVAKAARLLGMSYKTLWYRIEKFGLNSISSNEDKFSKKENN
jgi:DNA-binding NtrC family response regulator